MKNLKSSENLIKDMKYWIGIRDLLVNSSMEYGYSVQGALIDLVIDHLKELQTFYRSVTFEFDFQFIDLQEEKKPVLPEPQDWNSPNEAANENSDLLCDTQDAYKAYQTELAATKATQREEYRTKAAEFFLRHIGYYDFQFGDHDLISCGDVTLKFYEPRYEQNAHFTVIRQCKNCNAPYEIEEHWVRSIHDIGREINEGPEFCKNCDV